MRKQLLLQYTRQSSLREAGGQAGSGAVGLTKKHRLIGRDRIFLAEEEECLEWMTRGANKKYSFLTAQQDRLNDDDVR